MFELPAYSVAVALPTLLAAIVVAWRLWRVPEERLQWAALLLFLVFTAVVMLAQVRGARLAIMPAIPAAAWLIVAARARYLARSSIGSIAGLLISWLAFSGVIVSLVVTLAVNLSPGRAQQMAAVRLSKEPCLLPDAFRQLRSMPPQRVMTPVDLGAHLMLYTGHDVVSAPYHRNAQGVRDTFRFINDPIEVAQTVLEERGISLVVLCPAMAELQGLPNRAPDSFANLYRDGTLPDWLDEVTAPGSALQVFAVTLPQGP